MLSYQYEKKNNNNNKRVLVLVVVTFIFMKQEIYLFEENTSLETKSNVLHGHKGR